MKRGKLLKKLCDYYLNCLVLDDSSGVVVQAENAGHYLPHECVEFDEINATQLGGLQALASLVRKDQSRTGLFFGFPMVAAGNKSNSLDIAPVFVVPVRVGTTGMEAENVIPSINPAILKHFSKAGSDELISVLSALERDLGLEVKKESVDLVEIFSSLASQLQKIRPEWPWQEAINADDMRNIASSPVKNPGIYNFAATLFAERSPFTLGLEKELSALSEVKESSLDNTALGDVLAANIDCAGQTQSTMMLEMVALNPEQRKAVQNSQKENMSIVSGPPGTGKSEVSLHMILNAVHQGSRVLFVSKNNQAVDVVEQRVNALTPIPGILRVGSGEYNTRLAQYLLDLLSDACSEDKVLELEDLQQNHEEYSLELKALDAEANRLITSRNTLAQLNRKILGLRKIKSAQDWERLVGEIEPLQDAVEYLNTASDRLFSGEKSLWGRALPFMLNFRRRAYDDAQQKLGEAVTKAGLEKSCACDIGKVCELLEMAREYERWQISYNAFKSCRTLPQISREKLNLMRKDRHLARRLWEKLLQTRSRRVAGKQRQELSHYITVLRYVAESGQQQLPEHIRNQYNEVARKCSDLIPAWATTSLSVRNRLPFEAGFFDLVIFDEASQMDAPSALPLLYRAKRCVVIGDPKQLSHICQMPKAQDFNLIDRYGLSKHLQYAYATNSLFDLASCHVPSSNVVQLRDHHRSDKRIIEFPNRHFYAGELCIATDKDRYARQHCVEAPLRWVNVEGCCSRPKYGSQVNEEEAQGVVDYLKSLVDDSPYPGTIGVVSPFRAQANLIRSKISCLPGPVQGRLNQSKLVCDTVHKYQGDERDMMVFSPVLSKGMSAGAERFLIGNANLFNVAITRARASLVVVGDLEAIQQCQVEYLAAFASYVCDFGQDKNKDVEAKPAVLNPEDQSEWEHKLFSSMVDAGVSGIIPQYVEDRYVLDFAILQGSRKLDIEVDGELYHRNWTGEHCLRDQIRNERLMERGWDILRFWVFELNEDMDSCIRKIKDWMQKEEHLN